MSRPAAVFYRVKPARVRIWHAADHFTGPTLCGRDYAVLDAMVKRADAIELVECDACRVVLRNRAARIAAEEE